jgi:hypothetical protein
MITEIEQQILEYIESNEEYLRSFHNIYHRQYKQLIKGYSQKEYIVTAAIQMNKLKDYSNYTEYCNRYLEELGEGNKDYGEQLHNYYYETFILNMDKELQQLKQRYKKDDTDVYMAYELKTVWSFYNGFMIEKLIKEAIEGEATYTAIAERSEEEQKEIDTKMAIDMEVAAPKIILGFQIKSYTYLGIKEAEKQKHISSQQKYKDKYNGEVFYILYKNNRPIYQMIDNGMKVPYVSYLFTQKDILSLNSKQTEIGSYIGLAKEIDNRTWLFNTIKINSLKNLNMANKQSNKAINTAKVI